MQTIALICAHNGEPYVYEQLSSIASQSLPVSRIVVFDFNSTDRTASEVERFMAEHDAVDLRLERRDFALGACHSFLSALREIEISLGDDWLIYVCDQDDIWLPNKNEVIAAAAVKAERESPNFLIHHDVTITDENLAVSAASFYDQEFKRLLSRRDARLSLSFCTTIGHTIAISPSLLRLVNSLPFNEKLIMHDWAMSVVAELAGNRVFVPMELSLYRQHSGNLIGYDKLKQKRPISKFRNVVVLARRIAAQNALVYQSMLPWFNSGGVGRPTLPVRPKVRVLSLEYIRNVIAVPNARLRISAFLVLFWHFILRVRRALRR